MDLRKQKRIEYFGAVLVIAVLAVGFSTFVQTTVASNITSKVVVGNATPTTAAVVLNAGNSINLNPNVTTTINITFTVQDQNGCNDVFTNGNVTTTVYRAGVASGFNCTANSLNCYRVSTTTLNACNGSTSSAAVAATSAVDIYYFADATDSSSSYPAQDWVAHVIAGDATGATSSATSTHQELITLTAINVTTSSTDYGTIAANADTGTTDGTTPQRIATTTNAGNSSTTLRLRANGTLASGPNSIATTSQRYSSSSFTFPGTATQLTDTNTTVVGFFLLTPTSTVNVSKALFWGLTVPGGTATGSYTGTNVYTELFQP